MRLKTVSEVVFIFLLIAGLAGCGDDNPASTKEDNGPGVDVTPPAAVTDLRTDLPATTSIVLLWTSPGDDGDTGTASEYDLRFSTSPITDQNWDTATPADGETPPKPAGEIETIRVMNLDPGEGYYFAVKTSDEVPNISGLSNLASDSTIQEAVPPAAVADLFVDGFEDGSFRLMWTAPGDDGNAGNAFEYDIRYSTDPIMEQNWDAATRVDGEGTPHPAGFPDTMVVAGLVAGTNYFFALKTSDEVPNWSAISNVYPALANGNYLWIYPVRVKAGNYLTIIYRTPPSGFSKLHAHYRDEEDPWKRLAIEWQYPPGIHMMEWDFKRSGSYHSNPYNFYTIKLYWDTVVVAQVLTYLER